MTGLEFDSPEALLDWVKGEFQRTLGELLEGVFESTIIRVQKFIEHKSDCLPED
jgi:hypothetical protein